MATERVRVRVGERELSLSNLDKPMFPDLTKGEMIDYYTRIAPVLLPHLRDRPLTRIRFPNGVDGASFFEKNKPAATPGWVRVVRLPVPGSSKGRETIEYVVGDDLPTLVWLANLAALELHTPQWRIGRHPDMLVVDLDPGAPAGLAECCAVAVRMRDRLAADGIASHPKTSGRKGMQMCCPIAGEQSADEVSGYARRIAGELENADPRLVTAKMAKKLRPGKVFIDWSQNSAAKTTVAPYSLRGEREPTASAPLTWDEVAAGDVRPVPAGELLDRVADHGDLLKPLLTRRPPRCPDAP